jgi:hypothetical protein
LYIGGDRLGDRLDMHGGGSMNPLSKLAVSYVFSAAFLLVLSALVAGAAYIIVAILFKAIRFYYPNFGLPQTEEILVAHKEVVSHKLIAIDFVIQERLRQDKLRREQVEKMLRPIVPKMAAARDPQPEERRDEWFLVKWERNCPYYLVGKAATKDGLRTAFSPAPRTALRFPLEVAERLVTVIPDVMIAPANAFARSRMKIRQAASKLEVNTHA